MKKNKKKVIVTGGAGFIGSHTSLLLLEEGYDLVIFDSFYNSSEIVFKRFEKILDWGPTYLVRELKSKTLYLLNVLLIWPEMKQDMQVF